MRRTAIYRNAPASFAFEGEERHENHAGASWTICAPDAPAEIGRTKVESSVSRLRGTDGTGLPKADVLEYRFANGAKLMVRPSGTEPKIKVYLSAVGDSEAAADAVNDKLAAAVSAWMKA